MNHYLKWGLIAFAAYEAYAFYHNKKLANGPLLPFDLISKLTKQPYA